MTDKKGFNFFVYGSLREPEVFRSVAGVEFSFDKENVNDETLFAEPAFLSGYRKLSPDNVFYYAVKKRNARIEGILIHNVPPESIKDIDSYEGKRYYREQVSVRTASGKASAQAYLVSRETMKKHFGDRFEVNVIHEYWLRKRIKNFIDKNIRPGETGEDVEIERTADREMLATTERDLIMSQYGHEFISDYFLQQELKKPRPSLKHLRDIPEAEPFVRNYITLIIKQVILNQLDSQIQTRYRYEVEHMRNSKRYFHRSVSLLASLQILNANSSSIDLIVNKALDTMSYKENDLIDYIKYGIKAGKSIFERRLALFYLNHIESNLQAGLLPLGAELEFSNLGKAAVAPERDKAGVEDSMYDGFRYFNDFGLGVLMWKLGGTIDDHSGDTKNKRKVGFLELAPGKLNIEGELSRPATSDPWVLNQLIHNITLFYNIQPHSLHLSFQLRNWQIGKQRILPLGFVKCLLVLGGGLQRAKGGGLWVSRMSPEEITHNIRGEELVFSRSSKRRWHSSSEDTYGSELKHTRTTIQQYKFIRLDRRASYEPLIMCLKGLQLGFNPADYLTEKQLRRSSKLRRDYRKLKEWSNRPTQIDNKTISSFMNVVQKGLMNEGHNQPVHNLHYIDWALSAINVQLQMFNKKLREEKKLNY
jgi:gamma-glutamylcyclotransferase (GGCT)/AIG2-like uncharacterized protein YtfP